jgi:hypothetical protein
MYKKFSNKFIKITKIVATNILLVMSSLSLFLTIYVQLKHLFTRNIEPGGYISHRGHSFSADIITLLIILLIILFLYFFYKNLKKENKSQKIVFLVRQIIYAVIFVYILIIFYICYLPIIYYFLKFYQIGIGGKSSILVMMIFGLISLLLLILYIPVIILIELKEKTENFLKIIYFWFFINILAAYTYFVIFLYPIYIKYAGKQCVHSEKGNYENCVALMSETLKIINCFLPLILPAIIIIYWTIFVIIIFKEKNKKL